MDYSEKIQTLASMLRSYRPAFILTGAGISTESGIPDFRSQGSGLWTKYDPMQVASLSALRRDPRTFYQLNLPRWTRYANARPNVAHYALALLERKGYITGVITQNIDGLHRRAGSQRVWEVHGHLRTCHCMQCRRQYPFAELISQVNSGQNPPLCHECRGVLRPDVVLFEDRMREEYFQAEKALSGCQLLIVAGSSLQVYPVASLPSLARRLVIINRDPTPWDEQAELVINASLGQVFRDLLAALGEELNPSEYDI